MAVPATIYECLAKIYKAMFNQQKIEKVGDTYFLNTYDDDDETIIASCALKTFDEEDLPSLEGSVTPSIRLRSSIDSIGLTPDNTIYGLLSKLYKKEFNLRKNEEVVVGSGVISETLYDDDGVTMIAKQDLKDFNGQDLPSQLGTTSPQIREADSI